VRYFATHAGKSVLFISGAAFLLAWPPALPWIAAVVMLQLGVRHIILAFKEADRDVSLHATVPTGCPSLPAPGDGERGLVGNFGGAIRTRP
jgi:hypothetical protein